MATSISPPGPAETPVSYADRLGHAYSLESEGTNRKAIFGQYLTPPEVAVFMAELPNPDPRTPLRALDPGAGGGILSCALIQTLATRATRPSSVHLVAYESDAAIIPSLRAALEYAEAWAGERSLVVTFETRADDFVLREAPALTRADATGGGGDYGLAISNPPYLKVAKDDPRAQAAASVVHGQPNIYAFFMAISGALLAPKGDFVFITPRSFASGPYFRLFRERFFKRMRPEAVHVFGSRKDAFHRDEVLQENVVLHAQRTDGWLSSGAGEARVSHSAGTADLTERSKRSVPLARIVDTRNKGYVFRVPLTEEDDRVLDLVDSWPGRLEAYGWHISTGPVVPFRTDAITDEGKVPRTHAPLFWMQNVRGMRAEWPTKTHKAQYIRLEAGSKNALVPNRNYVLLRRFSAKEESRRLVAAPLLASEIPGPLVGLENHLNYIHKPSGTLTEHEALGLAAILSSHLLDVYFRISNGNTQVSATELRAMPLPPRAEIERVGATLAEHGIPPSMALVASLVQRVLDPSPKAPDAQREVTARG